MPLYKANMPPSVLYIVTKVPHIPGSFVLGDLPKAANDADWMESRVRTMSRGYVKKTEVMPAAPPHIKRRSEFISPCVSKNYNKISVKSSFTGVYNNSRSGHDTMNCCANKKKTAHILIEIVTSKLYGRVWNDSYTVRAVSSHESSPSFVFPHLHETFSDGELIFFTAGALDLEQDL
jgi:hypothetical protein